jgi:hypothetical protein
MATTTPALAPPPGGVVLFKVMESFVSGFAVLAAAEIGVADALADGPRTTDELARVTESHAPSLARLLRVLAPAGIVTEVEPGRFALTTMGEALQTEPPGSIGSGLQILSGFILQPLAETAHTVRTGESGFARLFGETFYEYLDHHPEQDGAFGRAMNMLRAISAPITEAYDFSGVDTLVDVGGGQGWRMIEVLQAQPHLRGILFDRPGVVEQARLSLADAGFGDRCEVVGGSFFDEIPAGGDCYLLSAVIPNWDDAHALTILRTVRRAMPDHGRLLLFEPVRPVGDGPHIAKTIDLLMLVLLGGQVRTEAELSALLEAADFRLSRVVTTASPLVVIEAIPSKRTSPRSEDASG